MSKIGKQYKKDNSFQDIVKGENNNTQHKREYKSNDELEHEDSYDQNDIYRFNENRAIADINAKRKS